MKPRKQAAIGLTLPLIAFIGFTLIAPLGMVVVRSVHDPTVADALPKTLALLEAWNEKALPSEAVYQSAAAELAHLLENRKLGAVATRINRLYSGMHTAVVRTARKLRNQQPGAWREAMIEADPIWADVYAWQALRWSGARFTWRNYLHALDLKHDTDGTWTLHDPGRRIYTPLLGQTLLTSAIITLICLLLGYPMAYLIANTRPRWANLLLLAVMLSFWISVLVRTSGWIALLQHHGILNDLLVAMRLIGDQARFHWLYSRTGTVVATTQVMLPFLIMPLYSVMRGIPPLHRRAAASLGATPWQAFFHVYLPLTLPGVVAGALLVYILSVGYYVTPALVGGQGGQMFSNIIDYHMQHSLNWGLAAALNMILLVCVAALLVAYSRLLGLNRIQLG